MFRTSQRNIGIAPAVAEEVDMVYMIKGCRTPLVLRKINDHKLILVGDCYVH